MSLDIALNVEIDRQLPDAESDSTEKPLRGGRYGEAYSIPIWPEKWTLSDEGTYQIGTSPVPGTGIAFAVNASVSETAGNFIYLKNNESQGNTRAKRIYMDYLRLICTAIPAAGVSGQFFLKVDNKDRYTSGGTQITPVNANIDSGTGTVGQFYAGAITTIAPSPSARTIGRGVLRSIIPALNDEYIFSFGQDSAGSGISLATSTAQRMTIPCGPLVIGPQNNLCLQLWFPSNAVTPASFEIDAGWSER
jgi:hypothetical protein